MIVIWLEGGLVQDVIRYDDGDDRYMICDFDIISDEYHDLFLDYQGKRMDPPASVYVSGPYDITSVDKRCIDEIKSKT